MWNTLIELLFPSPCRFCGYLGLAICWSCEKKLGFSPHHRRESELKIYSGFYYEPDSVLAKLIYDYKYSHQASLVRILGPPLLRTLELFQDGPIFLVPVPLHPRRERERGYNQAGLLASWISKRSGIPVCPALKRIKWTGQQAKMEHQSDRYFNMQDAFEIVRNVPEGSQAILVDDIVTTGSTLQACTEVLRRSGIKQVRALTLADRA